MEFPYLPESLLLTVEAEQQEIYHQAVWEYLGVSQPFCNVQEQNSTTVSSQSLVLDGIFTVH